jgi:hypothetical protein
MKTRETGYYRVKKYRNWYISYYTKGIGWLIPGLNNYVTDNFFLKIDDEKINVRPVNNKKQNKISNSWKCESNK